MIKLSPRQSKFLVTIGLTLLILSAFALSGFTIVTFDQARNQELSANFKPIAQLHRRGEAVDSTQPAGRMAQPTLFDPRVELNDAGGPGTQGAGGGPGGLVDVIRNGSFEELDPDEPSGVAAQWQPFSNGQAWFGWYDELWPEAIRTGEHAQLMEIFQVEANILDRAIAVYQTINVVPNARYDLTIHAIMRSQTQAADRNKDEFAMHWGVDYAGEGSYDNVQQWAFMPLTEQFRLGSTGEFPEDVPLFYETITGTIYTTNTNRITLFIRGLKKFPNGTEVNFDIDDVSLVGPAPGGAQRAPAPATPAPASPTSNLPSSGATLTENISVGPLLLSSLVLVILGGSAIAGLLRRKEKSS